jgi:hypothetical protein
MYGPSAGNKKTARGRLLGVGGDSVRRMISRIDHHLSLKIILSGVAVWF